MGLYQAHNNNIGFGWVVEGPNNIFTFIGNCTEKERGNIPHDYPLKLVKSCQKTSKEM